MTIPRGMASRSASVEEQQTESRAATDGHRFSSPITIKYMRAVRRLSVKAGLYVLGFTNEQCCVGRSAHLRPSAKSTR
jgi:hypothetical protein